MVNERSPLRRRSQSVSQETVKYTPVGSATPVVFARDEKEYGLKFAGEKVRLFVVVTMYNEEREGLERTLSGIAGNIEYLCDELKIDDFWKEVVICIVSDGRAKLKKCTMDYLTGIGLYSPMLIEEGLKRYDDISVHLFENLVSLEKSNDSKFAPLQMMFALKERNRGKIDSHWWYFYGFAPKLNPDYCFLLDAGTKPEHSSFYYMFRAMERDENIAGVAGEIAPLNAYNINPLVAAQVFEYKVASILDKTMESMFGYISVLPGAFSAYRYKALLGNPLKMYFHHLHTQLKDQTPFQANMYLAEDRILCYELVAKDTCRYTLKYVKEAVARTDVPTDLADLIKQRRRWLNGSLFALLYALYGWGRLLKSSSHPLYRKLLLTLQFFYYVLMTLLQWLSVANFYLVFYALIQNYSSSDVPNEVFKFVFGSLLVLQAILGLGNQPKYVNKVYALSAFIYGLLSVLTLGILCYRLIFDSTSFTHDIKLLISLALSLGGLFLILLIYRTFLSTMASFLQYIFLSPVYLIIFPIYSLCNVHDISWGTKDRNLSHYFY